MTPNPKPKNTPGVTSEDTQTWSPEDIQNAGITKHRSPRNQSQSQTPAPAQNVAVQITALIVLLIFVLAVIASATYIVVTLKG